MIEAKVGPTPMPSRPYVTVLIPAYNAAGFIEEAVRSALQQTFTNLEVLIIDDGSEDGTAKKVEAIGGSVRLLKVGHGGLASARNHGLRAASGRFILFLDADDILESTLVGRAVAFLERRPELAFVFCNPRFFYPDGRTTWPLIPARTLGDQDEIVLNNPLQQVLEAGYCISSSGLCARREVLLEAGFFDETLWGAEDFEYWSRLYLRRPVGYLAEPLVRLRRHPGSMTNQAARMIPCMAISMDKVIGHCLSSGRADTVAAVRRYRRRSIRKALRDLVSRGDNREALRLLWRYRGLLWGPHWALLVAACLAPGFVIQALVRLKSWFHAGDDPT